MKYRPRRSASLPNRRLYLESLEARHMMAFAAEFIDAVPGPDKAAGPTIVVADGESAYFAGYDEAGGSVLWRSDGTSGGTHVVADVKVNRNIKMATAGGLVYFVGGLASPWEHELWCSDGTAEGTRRLGNFIVPENGRDVPLVEANGELYFAAFDGVSVHGLWKTDGTEEGTSLVYPAAVTANLAAYNGNVYFAVSSPSIGYGVGKTNGTPEGTTLLYQAPTTNSTSTPRYLTINGNTLFFTAVQAETGQEELWKSDGTPAGTARVFDVPDDAGNRGVYPLASIQDSLFFRYGLSSGQLWKTDGTAEGTVLVKGGVDPLTSGTLAGGPGVAVIGDTLFFPGIDDQHGKELWRSDGTPEGTVMVKDINPSGSADIQEITAVNGFVFFSAQESNTTQLWSSDGTELGTSPVKDFQNPLYLTAAGTRLFGVGYSPEVGWELGMVRVSTPPVLTSGSAVTYVENNPAVLIAADATVSDSDSTNFATGTLKAEFADAAQSTDRLAIRSAGDLAISGDQLLFKGILIGTFTGGIDAEPLVVTFNEKASPFRAQMVLRNVTYRSLSERPNDTPRQLIITLTDGDGGISDPVTKSLTITPVNDAPKLNTSLTPTLAAINENNRNAWGTPVWMLLPGYSDVDAGALKGLAITSASGRANGAWQYTLDGGASWLDLGAVSLSSAKLLPAQGNLSRVRFVPNANFHGTVQLGYFAWDQTQGAAGGTFDLSGSGKFGGTTAFGWGFETASLTVKPVNNPPLLTLPSAPVGYALNSPAVLLASTATLKDPDTVRFAGGWLKVEIISGADANDRLSIDGPFTVVEGNLIWNNQDTMGTVQGGAGSEALMIQLNANATLYRVEQLVRSIKFGTLGSSKTGLRTVAFSVSDGTSGSNVASLDVQVA